MNPSRLWATRRTSPGWHPSALFCYLHGRPELPDRVSCDRPWRLLRRSPRHCGKSGPGFEDHVAGAMPGGPDHIGCSHFLFGGDAFAEGPAGRIAIRKNVMGQPSWRRALITFASRFARPCSAPLFSDAGFATRPCSLRWPSDQFRLASWVLRKDCRGGARRRRGGGDVFPGMCVEFLGCVLRIRSPTVKIQ